MTDTRLDKDALSHLKALRDFLPESPYDTNESGDRKDNYLYEKFENGNLKYKNEYLDRYVKPLLKSVGLEGWRFTVWRFQTAFWWKDLPGAVNIIPIRVISPGARSDPGGPLTYGIMRRIDGPVYVEPKLEAVFAVPQSM